MKYQDNSAAHTINGYYVGVKVGSHIQDATTATKDDGYVVYKTSEHIGTVTQDSASNAVNPTPVHEA